MNLQPKLQLAGTFSPPTTSTTGLCTTSPRPPSPTFPNRRTSTRTSWFSNEYSSSKLGRGTPHRARTPWRGARRSADTMSLTIAIGSRAWWTRQLVRRLVGAGATLFTIRALPGGSANRVVVAQRSGGRGLTTCRRRGVLTRRDSRTGGAFRGGGRGSHDLCPRPGIRGAGERVGHAGRLHDGGRSRPSTARRGSRSVRARGR